MNLAWINSPVWLIINALVAFRLTRLWIDDMVPPLPRWREKIEDWSNRAITDPDSTTQQTEKWGNQVATYGQPIVLYLVKCYWCVGFWVSILVTLAASLTPSAAWTLIALPFALSTVVGLIGTRD